MKPLRTLYTFMLTATLIGTITCNNETNSSLPRGRIPRVTGKITKLYSGINPNNSLCAKEGYQGDDADCAVFYRCIKSEQGKYTVFRFQCGPGTVYDPDTELCNHPKNTKRLHCKNIFTPSVKSLLQSSDENEIDFSGVLELPSPIKSNEPIKHNKNKRQDLSVYQLNLNTASSSKVIATTTESLVSQIAGGKPNQLCFKDGFIGDSDDCRKFYRCVSNGRGGFIRYEFMCSEKTAWDDEVQNCNHLSSISRNRCAKRNDDNFNAVEPEKSIYGNKIFQTNYNKDTTSVTPDLSINDNSDKQIQNKENHNAINVPLNVIQAQNPANDRNQVLHSPSLPNRVSELSPVQSYGIENDDDNNDETTPATTQTPLTNTRCTTSGFIGDPKNCKKFYRCVDNGNGGYTRYEFSCGDGTVWDSSIEGCNHAWAVKNCGQSQTSSENSSQKPEPTVTTPYPSPTTTTESSNQIQSTTEHNNSGEEIQLTSVSTMQPTTVIIGTAECQYNGFIGDEHDCKKFYRCVDDGKGKFIKYEFSCGEGTVWDPEILACNHAYAVSKCGGLTTNEYNKESTTTSRETNQPAESTTSITSTTSSDYEDSGYGQHPQATVTTMQTSTETTSTVQNKPDNTNVCQNDGFIGNEKDCKKFYRCVENGRGGFIQYEFTCGEGTVWDSEIQACNHPSSVKTCGTNQSPAQSQSPVNDETTTSKVNENTSSNSPNPTTVTTSTTTSINNCESEGFYGDSNNCKKFYRCVDNGKNGYDKYEFICGDGTMWDQEITACNHQSSTCKQSSGSNSVGSTESVTEKSTTVTEKVSESTVPVDISSEKVTDKVTSTTQVAVNGNEDQCTSDGFYANRKDCRKFYRCVDNGKGGYTKYEFMCGQGTIWVQEIQGCDHDNDLSSCSQESMTTEETTQLSSTAAQQQNMDSKPQEPQYTSTTVTPQTQIDADEYPGDSNVSSNDDCSAEGFYPNKDNCQKFYRCVDNGNGGFTRYDFECGEGTAWDQNIQACNHINDVENCKGSSTHPIEHDETIGTTTTSTESTTAIMTSSSGPSTSSSGPSTLSSGPSTSSSGPSTSTSDHNQDKCTEEGYYGNSADCHKFYRCVDNGKGGYTKYDFSCGEGTIWDQEITACNHPRDVNNPSCKSNAGSDTSTSSSSMSQGTTSTESTTTTTNSMNHESSNSSEVNQQHNKDVNCSKEGFYADSEDCKKFYRCVDWDGNGERFSVYYFECGEGTIWDPSLDTCNHEESVYPPRNCSSKQSQSESGNNSCNQTTESSSTAQTTEKTSTEQTTTQKESTQTTIKETTASKEPAPDSTTTTEAITTEMTSGTSTEKTSTTEHSTSEQATSEQTTIKQTTEEMSTQQSTTEESTSQQSTTEQTTTMQSITEQTTTEEATTHKSTTEETTTQQSTTEETTSTTSEQTTTTEDNTTQKTTTTEQTTTTEDTTTQNTTTEQTTTTEDATTQKTTTEEITTNESSTEQSTEQTTTQKTSTEDSSTTTTESTQTTSESQESTTESSQQTTDKECPETDDDQSLYVCPTGFKRHPKYCNMFYQCTEDDDTHEVKMAVFNCPNNTIYDENKTQCVEESKTDEKCKGQIAQKRRFKRLNAETKQPMVVSTQRHNCPTVGHYPFEREDECSPAFLKCERSKSGKIRGFIYQCPEGYVYWSVSRRCEQKFKMFKCKNSINNWSGRYDIPIERNNVAL